jgi:hypothetical protein
MFFLALIDDILFAAARDVIDENLRGRVKDNLIVVNAGSSEVTLSSSVISCFRNQKTTGLFNAAMIFHEKLSSILDFVVWGID